MVNHGNIIESSEERMFRILCLDGGGAKGFYTLGVLKEIEAMVNCPLHEKFDLIFGTSTGAIIATLITLGYPIDEIHTLYQKYVPSIMGEKSRKARTKALSRLASEVFKDRTFEDVKTNIGVVATRWATEKPMIFKSNINQAHGRKGTFVPGFGVKLADAVQASCSAYPYFERKSVVTSAGDEVELFDGGFCANNPTLYAIADATAAMGKNSNNLRVISIGVGHYPEPKPKNFLIGCLKKIWLVQLLQKTLETNTQSMDQLRAILFKNVPTIRISDTFEAPAMATDLMECNLNKLNLLRQCGSESFAAQEDNLKAYLL